MSGHTGQRSAAEPGDPPPAEPPSPGTAAGSRANGAVTSAPPLQRGTGTVIAERYQLLAQVGSDESVHAAFWRARDTVLARDVALTLLRSTGEDGEVERAGEMTAKALRWGKFEHAGCARLLDVMPRDHNGLPDDVLAMAVTEWVPGRSLAETVRARPLRASTLLAMLDPLAQGTEAAHRQGLVLGCGHPQRIRITPEGGARLAFALPHPDITPADDVRGLGAVLYTLLTGHWPLSSTDAELAGLPEAPRDVQGVVMPPGLVRPGVSVEVSALALGALGAGASHGRVHTAAGVHKVVAELMQSEQEVALLPPPDDGTPDRPDEVWRVSPPPAPVDPERRRKLTLALGGLGAGLLVVLGYLGVQVGSLLGVTPPSPPRIVIASPPTAPPAPPPAQAPGPVAAPGAPAPPAEASPAPDPGREAVVHPASVRVFDPTGDPDNAGRISRLVDDDPKSSWSTYIYKRPFPALKPGVGIMVSFASPVQLSRLNVISPSSGSRMEIRSAPTADAPFAQTVPIGELTVAGTDNSVTLTGSQPVQNVLVWITKLGGGGDQNVTEIEDLRFERVTG